jgi:hypothetical protein
VALGYAAGMDGTAGLQPRGTLVRGCMMSDVGVFGKQSACFSQAIAMQTRLEENICYNVPRSGFVRTRRGLHSQSSCHARTISDCVCVSSTFLLTMSVIDCRTLTTISGAVTQSAGASYLTPCGKLVITAV